MLTPSTPQQTVYRRLSEDIQRGVLRAGARLQSERSMATSLGVSRMTLRAALTRLADEGKLERSAQRGWFVAPEVLGEPPSTLQSFSEMAEARGLRATARILVQLVRTADLNEASKLAVAPTTPVVEIQRVRGFNGMPVCLDQTVVPLDLAPGLATEDLNDASLYRYLDGVGVRIHRSSYTVQAAAADARQAELLGLAEAAPVLIGAEVAYNSEGVPLLLGHATYRGDAYRFEADLYRQATPES